MTSEGDMRWGECSLDSHAEYLDGKNLSLVTSLNSGVAWGLTYTSGVWWFLSGEASHVAYGTSSMPAAHCFLHPGSLLLSSCTDLFLGVT